MLETASDYFAARIDDYDSLIRRAVPRYDEMIERLVDYLPPGAERVLELGSGTGNLSLALARRYPAARLTLVDASAEMLDLAGHRLDRESTRIASRFEELDLAPLSFDLITSCISLHHVLEKGALFARLRKLLEPGCPLVFSDQMRGGTDQEHELNWTRWLEFCRRPGHCTEEEIESLLAHAGAHDHYVSVLDHVRLLEAAGFRDVDVVWRNWMWGLLVARA